MQDKTMVNIAKKQFDLSFSMIDNFEDEYMWKYWELQRAQWSNYFEGGNLDLSKFDLEIYKIAKKFNGKVSQEDRRDRVASLIIIKDLVEKNPLVSNLRNKLDSIDNYTKNMSKDIKENNMIYNLALANEMKEDVLELINIRNHLSTELGFSSYPDLILSAEEIDRSNLINLLNDFVEKNLNKARKIIEKYNISWDNWFNDLYKIGSTININYNPLELIKLLISAFGFEKVEERIQINFSEEGYSGYAAQLSSNDIRIVVEPLKSLNNINTLFHELGHAISYALNEEQGVFKILPCSYDEAMAVVMEYLAPMILLSREEQEKVYEVATLEYVRCAISSLYEFDLWKNPEKAEELYVKHYSKLGIKIDTPSIWTLDTFRSIDPVYIHNYVIGATLAEKIISLFEREMPSKYKHWGEWLFNSVYINGRCEPLRKKIKILGDLI